MVTLYCIAFHNKVKKGIKRKISHVILNVMDLDEILKKHIPNYRFRNTPSPYYFVDYDDRLRSLLLISFLRQLLIHPANCIDIFYTLNYQQVGICIKGSVDEALNKCIVSHNETEKIKREQFDTDENTKQLTIKFIW